MKPAFAKGPGAIPGPSLSHTSPSADPSCTRARVTKLIIGALVLLGGAAVTFALHFAEAPEELYRWLYHRLLSGLDVPEDPSESSVDAVRYTSLIGGIVELVAGVCLLALDWLRRRSRPSERL